ncbi:MAG: hypothetical protein AAGD01_17060 [Acidobacteriota bacterium]
MVHGSTEQSSSSLSHPALPQRRAAGRRSRRGGKFGRAILSSGSAFIARALCGLALLTLLLALPTPEALGEAAPQATESLTASFPALIAAQSLPAQGISSETADEPCASIVTARVVALDQPFTYNRFGTHQPGGMVFALEHDVTSTRGPREKLVPGRVALRNDKRPRPLALRVHRGSCLRVIFTNLLAPEAPEGAPATRWAGVRVLGLSPVSAFDEDGRPLSSDRADGSLAGANEPSLVPPGGRITYLWSADQEGTFLLYSSAGNFGHRESSADNLPQYPAGHLTAGLFGAVHVEPEGSLWLRSQVSREQLAKATVGRTPLGQPILDFHAVDARGLPLLSMLDPNGELAHSDLTAIIAHPGTAGTPGAFPATLDSPEAGRDAFREITLIYHEADAAAQAFPCAFAPPLDPVSGRRSYERCPLDFEQSLTEDLADALDSVEDRFAINYAADGLGSRLLANRFGVGASGDCVGCRLEEQAHSSWVAGDPGLVVTRPTSVETTPHLTNPVTPKLRALYTEDPSNVYHSYLGDRVRLRVLHGGGDFHLVHQQSGHRLIPGLAGPGGDRDDAQLLGPGSGVTLELDGGAGGTHGSPGDALLGSRADHHRAGGMWALWRIHDVFEEGTRLDRDGLPVRSWWADGELMEPGARALPDGEIPNGTPIPALVPLPDRPMAPMPGRISLSEDGRESVLVARIDSDPTDPAAARTADDEPMGLEAQNSLDELLAARGLGGSSNSPGPAPGERRWWILSHDDERPPVAAESPPNPGFPFFVPGRAGQRAPQPPLDVAWATEDDSGLATAAPQAEGALALDGGLPRHLITGSTRPDGGVRWTLTRFEITKTLEAVDARRLPESGTAVEQLAMSAHADSSIASCSADGSCQGTAESSSGADALLFPRNGRPPAPGAPYADPCSAAPERHYRSADVELDVVINKAGWHVPQHRLATLWEDLDPLLDGESAPQPLFLRANAGECVELWHANLTPARRQLDDYRIGAATPLSAPAFRRLDFDFTASAGSAVGFNYEDGTLAPAAVRERIDAINAGGGLLEIDGQRSLLQATIHPAFGRGPRGAWVGARTTVQRLAAPLSLADSTSPFADGFSSAARGAGLAGAMLVEPADSLWLDAESGGPLVASAEGGRRDGGPTSWRAIIQPPEGEAFRESALLLQEAVAAYPESTEGPAPGAFYDLTMEIQQPTDGNRPTGLPATPARRRQLTPVGDLLVPVGSAPVPPWPRLLGGGIGRGAVTANYRNEPLSLRMGDAVAPTAARGDFGEARDSAHVLRSIPRGDAQLDQQPLWYPPLQPGIAGPDPYTPLLQGYGGDALRLRMVVDGGESLRHLDFRGLTPNTEAPALGTTQDAADEATAGEPAVSQSASSHRAAGPGTAHDFRLRLPHGVAADYLWLGDSAVGGLQGGNWGLLRSYDPGSPQSFLPTLAAGGADSSRQSSSSRQHSAAACPANAPRRAFHVVALDAAQLHPDGITYRPEAPVVLAFEDGSTETVITPLVDPEGLLYLRAEDLILEETASAEANSSGAAAAPSYRLAPGRRLEPLVLRARAGECLEVTLENRFDPASAAFLSEPDEELCKLQRLASERSGRRARGPAFRADLRCGGDGAASLHAGLSPQDLTLDATADLGFNIGRNAVQTAAPGEQITYRWYAGRRALQADGSLSFEAQELGAINLLPADPLNQHSRGLFGALLIEPVDARWVEDPLTRLAATVHREDSSESFREMVLIFQDDLDLAWRLPADPLGAPGSAESAARYLPLSLTGAETAAIGYSTELLDFRLSPPANHAVALARSNSGKPQEASLFPATAVDQTCILGSQWWQGDPATPVFAAHAGTPVRLRLLHPGGRGDGHVFALHGHGWSSGQSGGAAPWRGELPGLGPGAHADLELSTGSHGGGAGGRHHVAGDYLYRSFPAAFLEGGLWGLFRVGPEVPAGESRDIVTVTSALLRADVSVIHGARTQLLGTTDFAQQLHLYAGPRDPQSGQCSGPEVVGTFDFDPQRPGTWTWRGPLPENSEAVCVSSSGGGLDDAPLYSSFQCPSLAAPDAPPVRMLMPRGDWKYRNIDPDSQKQKWAFTEPLPGTISDADESLQDRPATP